MPSRPSQHPPPAPTPSPHLSPARLRYSARVGAPAAPHLISGHRPSSHLRPPPLISSLGAAPIISPAIDALPPPPPTPRISPDPRPSLFPPVVVALPVTPLSTSTRQIRPVSTAIADRCRGLWHRAPRVRVHPDGAGRSRQMQQHLLQAATDWLLCVCMSKIDV
ncbi:hypothetical protein BRADI_2g24795v3 [Brachypodium distachyon]|uniref:Uncharacterized protein n=1 Tax=Brachypodium distachyon TaxID=15368 RepID=A0A2K2DA92_BRADI|nr:hypothetical protein BRADI_2g24795v3 [Brachypodium distachyon]